MITKKAYERSIVTVDVKGGVAKEAILNILYFRFATSFLDPIWNRNADALIAADGCWYNSRLSDATSD